MPITVKSEGRTFTFPDGTTTDQMGEAIDSFFDGTAIPTPPEGGIVSAVAEPAAAIATGLVSEVGAGFAGIAQAVNPFAEPGAGARAVEATRGLAFQPRTQAGQRALKSVGELVQKGVDLVNVPISGIAGLAELLSGQGLDQAAQTIQNIKEQGLQTTLGERTFEATGNPLAATVAEALPTAIGGAFGVRGAEPALRGAARVATATAPAAQQVGQVGKAVFNFQSPTKRRIAELIEQGSTDVDTARFMLAKPVSGRPVQDVPRIEGPKLEGQSTGTVTPAPQGKLLEFLDAGGPRVAADKIATETIRQGFDEGVIAAVKGASPADRFKMLEMVEIMEKGKKNKLFAIRNRPSDIAGNTLLERFNVVKTANKAAGKELDVIARGLKGREVDASPAVNTFIDDLDSIGVELGDNFKPNFSGSDIEGIAPAERIISQIIGRMKTTSPNDALALHRLKRFIDEQVTFGKKAEGLAGKSEIILKKLRRNIDGILDADFTQYNRVNTTYAETIQAIDSLQDVAGRKMDLTAPNADKATGTLLRRLMSNAQSRVRLLDSIDDIEKVARKHGGDFDDDLLTQVLFTDELDAVFKPVARTSFQGQIEQAVKKNSITPALGSKAGLLDIAVKGASAIKARGLNEEAAFKSIKELLRRQ